jgi:MSHA pilin protein MshD
MKRRQQGMTLVELVIAIVVVSIAVTSVMGAMTTIGGRSADPVVLLQAQAIAESYMDEISSKAFVYPDPGATCKTIPASRSDYSAVCDYRALPDTVVRNSAGDPITELSAYSVVVVITENAGTDFVPAPATPAAPVILAPDALKIEVTVTSPNGPFSITGYRTRY